jgi:hypothetical protein
MIKDFCLAEGALEGVVEALLLQHFTGVEDCASVSRRGLEVSAVAYLPQGQS